MKTLFKFLLTRRLIILQTLSLLSVVGANSLLLIIPALNSEMINYYLASGRQNTSLEAITIILILFSFVITFFQLFLASYIAESMSRAIRNAIVKKVTGQTYNFILSKGPAKILTNVTSDIIFVKDFLTRGISTVVTAVVMITGSTILMFVINKSLAVYVVLIIPLLVAIFFVVFGKAARLFRSGQQARDQLNLAIDENIKAAMLVRIFNAETTESTRFLAKNQHAQSLQLKIVRLFSVLVPLVSMATYLGGVIIIGVGGYQVIKGIVSFGEVSAFYSYVVLFTTPIVILGFIANSVAQAMASARRITALLESKVTFKNGTKKLTFFNTLRFDNVSFHIDSRKESTLVLQNINFEIHRGERIGIIGTVGSGKTSLLNLILRFFEPSEGAIYLNNLDLRSYDINSVRAKTGFVFQDNFLFNKTIADNISFGNDIYSKQDIESVAAMSQIDEFVEKFPRGYAEVVSELGTTLSGGQKQRITLARALINKPELLILDDSTSKLDSSTESAIFERIRTSLPDLSMIIVAQKISSVKWCDYIYVMDQGHIVGKGTHEELSVSSFIYKEIELSQTNYQEQ